LGFSDRSIGEQAAAKVLRVVILSEAKNLSSI